MSILKEVAVSGSVGKQVVATAGKLTVLKGFTLTPSGANATIKIRDGGAAAASGEVVFFGRAPSAFGSKQFELGECGMRFDKGLHVTVIGTNAVAYLELE